MGEGGGWGSLTRNNRKPQQPSDALRPRFEHCDFVGRSEIAPRVFTRVSILCTRLCVGRCTRVHAARHLTLLHTNARQFGIVRSVCNDGAHTANVDCCVSTQCVAAATASRASSPARPRTGRPDSFRCAMHTDTGKHAPGKRLRDNKSISRRHVRLGSRIEKTVARQRRGNDSRPSRFVRTPTEIVDSAVDS